MPSADGVAMVTGDVDLAQAYSTRAFFDRVQAELTPRFAFRATTQTEWLAWRQELVGQLTALLGPFPERVALAPRLLDRVIEHRYVREKVVFESETGVSVPAYLLVPHGVDAEHPAPAILCLHGHGRGKDDVAGLAGSAKERHQRITALNYDYAHRFAERGYVALAPDARGFGERAADGMTCTWAMTAGLLLGKVLAGLRVWDAIRAIDYLEIRPEVDASRIGCVGFSWGGTHAIYTAALDERIAATVISGYFSTFQDILIDSGECPCQYVPNLLRYADLPDIVSLIAPRPLLIESGSEDQHSTPEVVDDAFPRVQRAYQVANAADQVTIDRFAGHHRFSGRDAFDWMDRWTR